MRIEFVPGLGNTPARVNRKTGTIFLNSDTWNNYTDFEKKLIILHEQAHYLLQTKNEQEADAYAVQQFIGSEFESLKKSLQSFYSTLDMSNPAHRDRYKAVLRRIIQTDYYKFGNYKLQKILYKMYEAELKQITIDFLKSKGVKDINELSQAQKDALMTEFFKLPEVISLLSEELKAEVSNYSDFPGIGLAISGAVSAGKALIGSAVGKKVTGWIGDKIGGLFGNKDKAKKEAEKSVEKAGNKILGGSQATQSPQQDTSQIQMLQMQMQAQAGQDAQIAKQAEEARIKAEQEKKKKTMLYIGIGVGVIVLAVVLFVVLRKK